MPTFFRSIEDFYRHFEKKYNETYRSVRRPLTKWQLPPVGNLSLIESHEFLRHHLDRPRSGREEDLRAKLLTVFLDFGYPDDFLLYDTCIVDPLDELLFGGIVSKHTEFIRLRMEDTHGWARHVPHRIGYNPTTIVAVDSDWRHKAMHLGYKPRAYAATIWGTLIHEMLHAFTMIATNCSGDGVKETCQCGHKTTHGPVWAEMINLLVKRLDMGITARDMTNRLELCHEPDPRESLTISTYKGVLAANGRRYSESQRGSVWRNVTRTEDVEALPVAKAMIDQVREQFLQRKTARQRRNTWPARDGELHFELDEY
ncbi:hypothetical protein Slin15195_G000850 [Septoria linicola]|uniref:SprT-like domain-containing protein n=1 Tax=Septoria linicola TaxID=215465 RepID=A0A9Q9AL15_9PEZI|nr:hypothetical protein Slin15195_G000850 [Septoria linicola]